MCQEKLPVSTASQVGPLHLKKSVQFGDIQEFPMELPSQVIVDNSILYYTQDELKRLTRADIKAKKLAERGTNDDSLPNYSQNDDEICFRGLEHSLNNTQRKRRIREHVRAVLLVYFEQRRRGSFDAEKLCVIAKSRSRQDRKYARRMASVDASEAFEDSFSCNSTTEQTADTRESDSSTNSSLNNSSKRGIKRWVSGKLSRFTSRRESK